jgi:hypothetical protein
MVSCPGELFRRGAGDETFGDEMRAISMKLEFGDDVADTEAGVIPAWSRNP